MQNILDGLSNYFGDFSIYLGSNDVELLLNTYIDISDATDFRIRVMQPIEDVENSLPFTVVEWIGELYNEKYIRYLIKSSDIPVRGIYKINSRVIWDDKDIYGETALLRVKALGE